MTVGVDQIDRVAGVGPGVDEVFAGIDPADVHRCARVVDDGVAALGEADAHDQMPVRAGSAAVQPVGADGQCDGNTGSDPIFHFGQIGHAADIGPDAAIGASVGGVERPVAGA